MFSIFPRRDHADTCPGSPVSEDLLALEAVLRHWVQGRARPELVLIHPEEGSTVSLDQVLARLCSSSAPLGAACSRRLGLSDDTTVSEAAEELLFARHDPGGPRCRSFRSASYYLYGLARIAATVEPAHPRRPRCLQPPTDPSIRVSADASDDQRPVPEPSARDHHEVRAGADR